jgi:hypothetical protein
MRESVIGATRERPGTRFFQIGHRGENSITGVAPLDTRFSPGGVTVRARSLADRPTAQTVERIGLENRGKPYRQTAPFAVLLALEQDHGLSLAELQKAVQALPPTGTDPAGPKATS